MGPSPKTSRQKVWQAKAMGPAENALFQLMSHLAPDSVFECTPVRPAAIAYSTAKCSLMNSRVLGGIKQAGRVLAMDLATNKVLGISIYSGTFVFVLLYLLAFAPYWEITSDSGLSWIDNSDAPTR